ncbi:4-O-methyl-glucuronoyl methylesterase 1-like [Chelmon rostratus]|uniref:4-O-methyl-glucuronoyl methylesterase 1-like n=1 Tax=Chelmon rostratus TaxID=109905 RepID=UPI001BE7B015|nr:4-O-methyl-glucuronoyl methylesterase 1-like [Chelmon rostratus]
MVKISINDEKNVNEKRKSKMYAYLSGHKGPLLNLCPPVPPQTTPPPYLPAATRQTTPAPTAPPAVSSPDVPPPAKPPSALNLDELEGAVGGLVGQTADSTTAGE